MLRELKKFYAKHGRHTLPWRQFDRPLPAGRQAYKILVSEVMLQQTQVERVVPYYKKFIKKFPTAQALAGARLSAVLREWQGLGYNRRAKYLHDAAKLVVRGGWGQKLPGVGSYTKHAVEAFAYNKPTVFVETNIRTVFIHSNILKNVGMISDKDLLPLVARALKKSKMQPRHFYAALMDYGAYLKQSGVRNNSRSAHYTRQSKFEGSLRQVRGAILRALSEGPKNEGRLHLLIQLNKQVRRARFGKALEGLKRDGLIKKEKGKWRIA